MAVTQIAGGREHYIGLSSDTKPTPTGSDVVPVGSTFFESNTGVRYIWTGSTWVVLPQTAAYYIGGLPWQ